MFHSIYTTLRLGYNLPSLPFAPPVLRRISWLCLGTDGSLFNTSITIRMVSVVDHVTVLRSLSQYSPTWHSNLATGLVVGKKIAIFE